MGKFRVVLGIGVNAGKVLWLGKKREGKDGPRDDPVMRP